MGYLVNTYYRMALEFIIKHHPWNQLKENSSLAGPNSLEIEIMKGIMDGHTIQDISKSKNITVTKAKKMLTDGMRTANVKNLYELIVWGLRAGIIKDEPKTDISKQLDNPEYSDLKWFLNQTVTGNVDLPKSSQQNLKKSIAQKFNLGSSDAAFIRFAFQVMSPIGAPKSFRGYKTHIPHFIKTGVSSKNAIIKSKFTPANIDPNLHPNYQPIKPRHVPGKSHSIYQARKDAEAPSRMAMIRKTQGGSIQLALKILGIHPSVIKNTDKSNSFWDNKPSYLWDVLELAKDRYDREIAHAHPDKGGDDNRFKQVSVAWNFVKEMFARRGYELHK